MSFISQLSVATRLNDWRFSFVPFILGCVYLWLWWFQIPFTGAGVLLLFLSLITTAGFASLGYLINELFDIPSDLKAGKNNRLAGLPLTRIAALFILSLSLTLLPWLYLPADKVSVGLIVAELGSFLLYSLPFPRLKAIPVISNMLDAAYAYVLPLALSFHTFQLASGTTPNGTAFFLILGASVITTGIRNIVIHQVDDVFRDKMSGILTLPRLLGVSNTNLLLVVCLIGETALHLAWVISMCLFRVEFALWACVYPAVLLFTVYKYKEPVSFPYLSIHKIRHLPDNANQIAFPLFTLALLLVSNWQWLVVIPVHALLLLPPLVSIRINIMLRDAVTHSRNFVPHYFQLVVIYPASLLVNHSIYFIFRLVGVDLKKQNKSALGVLKKLFRAE